MDFLEHWLQEAALEGTTEDNQEDGTFEKMKSPGQILAEVVSSGREAQVNGLMEHFKASTFQFHGIVEEQRERLKANEEVKDSLRRRISRLEKERSEEKMKAKRLQGICDTQLNEIMIKTEKYHNSLNTIGQLTNDAEQVVKLIDDLGLKARKEDLLVCLNKIKKL